MQCFFKGTSHVCHFPRILRPWKSLAKYRCIYSRMLVLNAVHLISQTNIHDFQKCVTFHNGMLQKVMLRYYMCVRIQHYFNNLQKSAASTQGLPKATFVQSTTALSIRKKLYNLLINTEYLITLCNMSGTLSKSTASIQENLTGKTLSKYDYCIYWRILLRRNSTLFYKMPPKFIHVSDTFQKSTASIQGRSLKLRLFLSTTASIEAFYHKAMLRSQRNTPPFPKV